MNGYVPLFRSRDVDELPLSDVGKYARHAVEHGRTEDLIRRLERKIRRHCIKCILADQIDSLIERAISNKQHECYLLLLEYKHKNSLFRSRVFALD